MSNTLVIRADASTEIGIGHVMRCLALAKAWQNRGGYPIFVTAAGSGLIEARLKSEEMEVMYLSDRPGSIDDASRTADIAHERNASWILTDGYDFSGGYQQIIKETGMSLLFIDDNGHADHYYADIVLNQNIHAHEQLYVKRESYTSLLLGTRFALLRREFLKWKGWKREIRELANKVLVTLGGGDPANATFKVIQALKQTNIDGMEVAIVVGPANPHVRTIERELVTAPFAFRLFQSVEDMAELMAWADIALAGAGSTSWELAFMGLPTLTLVLAENQLAIAERLNLARVVVNLGSHEKLSSGQIAQVIRQSLLSVEERLELAQRARALVDGEGIHRVLMNLSGEKVRLRRVSQEDAELLWEWANDHEVRLSAFSSEPILWDSHIQWFMRKLRESNSFFFIGLDEKDIPVGQVRFDTEESKAEIHVSIDRNKRGLGYGYALINMGVRKIFHSTPVRAVHAFIKPNNEWSVNAFEKAEFVRLGIKTVKGNRAFHFVREKKNGK